MPTKVDAIQPPKVTPAYEKSALPVEAWGDKSLPAPPPPPPGPDVTPWVIKANARLEPAWQDNELRGGRAFAMPGATQAEVSEVIAAFHKSWDVGACRSGGDIYLLFKPRRDTKIKR